MDKNLVCKRSYYMVLGCLMQNPDLLDDITKPLDRADFNTESFYELLFVAIYNLHVQGCKVINEFAVDSYLSSHDKQYQIFQNNDGLEWLSTALEMAEIANYDYYYHRLRKYSLLRYYEVMGYDTRSIYDTSVIEPTEAEKQEEKFEKLTEVDIVEEIENNLITIPKMRYCTNSISRSIQAGQGMKELIEQYMEEPNMGIPLSSIALNTVTRGARLGCLYLRSASSGSGKTRLAAADACEFSMPYKYNLETNQWDYNGIAEPTLYITTEIEFEDVQAMFISYVSGVEEEHIISGKYEDGEIERVMQAIEYLETYPLYIEHIPNFGIEDICNIVKRYKREYSVSYYCFDYIHTSLKLMTEVSSAAKGTRLREDQMLLMFADELKSLCIRMNVFMITATQLNGDYKTATIKDECVLRGSKAIADKVDIGCILTIPTKAELEKVKPIYSKGLKFKIPNRAVWIYKVRKGKLTKVILWQYVDLGTCRTTDLFVTNNDFELINVDFTEITNTQAIRQAIEDNSILSSSIKDEETMEEYVDEETGEIIQVVKDIVIDEPLDDALIEESTKESTKEEIVVKKKRFDF